MLSVDGHNTQNYSTDNMRNYKRNFYRSLDLIAVRPFFSFILFISKLTYNYRGIKGVIK